MKKNLILITLSLITTGVVFANTIKIKVSNYQFSPKTVNAKIGDTIIWVWNNGFHTTTSVSIPAGAASWNKPIDTTHKRFKYIVTKGGTYSYRCNFHFQLGMTGSINVSKNLAPSFGNFFIDEQNNKALLNWQIENNEDFAYFSVQKSTDGDDFNEVARIQPSSFDKYHYDDNTNLTNKYLYYQIELVDKKGDKQLSEIKMFTNKSATKQLITSLSPNPVNSSDHLMMQFNSDVDDKMLVQLFTASGTFISQTEMMAVKGLNNGHFHLDNLKTGVYYLVCTLGVIKEKHMIIVQ